MGTSNWQNIPFCVEVLMKIAPRRVLDVGVGFGRWGMIVREFCDVWYGRVLRSQWQVHIEGVEAFPPLIDEYHRAFYNEIHIGDFRAIVSTLDRYWDVVIFGDVLEHFEKQEAIELLDWALSRSDYVLVNIPLGSDWPQKDTYGNPYERHLSIWSAHEFAAFSLRRYALFSDFLGRPFGTFVLSLKDPLNVAQQLFSVNTATETLPDSLSLPIDMPDLRIEDVRLLEQARAVVAELNAIKRSRGYRVINRLRQSRFRGVLRGLAQFLLPDQGGILRTLARLNPSALIKAVLPPNHIRIRPLGIHNPASQGSEVWLLAVNPERPEPFDLQRVRTAGPWELRQNAGTVSGQCLYNPGAGWAALPGGRDVKLVFMTHPWSGLVEVAWRGRRLQVDLYSAETGTLQVVPYSGEVVKGVSALPTPSGNATIVASDASKVRSGPRQAFTRAEREWIERVACNPRPISVACPQWQGICSSAEQLFDEVYYIEDDLDEARALHCARVLIEANCPAIVIQGFPLTYVHLVNALHRLEPRLPLYVIWHGNFLQTREEYAWKGFCIVEQLCRSGFVTKWGFVKKGMAEIVAKRGLRTGFIMNMVRTIPTAPSMPLPGGPHLGIWNIYDNWRKPPYAMLAAASIVDNAIVHASGVTERAQELVNLLGVKARLSAHAIERQRMQEVLAQMHLNLYVTLSECAPMLPLESLAAGTPCLIGPNSHYFEDNTFLHQSLVVPYPDCAFTIASYIRSALENRSAIIQVYREYAPAYNAQALNCLEEFLEMPVGG